MIRAILFHANQSAEQLRMTADRVNSNRKVKQESIKQKKNEDTARKVEAIFPGLTDPEMVEAAGYLLVAKPDFFSALPEKCAAAASEGKYRTRLLILASREVPGKDCSQLHALLQKLSASDPFQGKFEGIKLGSDGRITPCPVDASWKE